MNQDERPARVLMEDDPLAGDEVVAMQQSWADGTEWVDSYADWDALPPDVKRLVFSKLSLHSFSVLRGVSRAWRIASERYEHEDIEAVKMRLTIARQKEEMELQLRNRKRPVRDKCCVCDCEEFWGAVGCCDCCQYNFGCCFVGSRFNCSSNCFFGTLCYPCIIIIFCCCYEEDS